MRRIDEACDSRGRRNRPVGPAAGTEVVVGVLRGKAGPGIALCGADYRNFAGRHRQAPAIVHVEEIALQDGIAGLPQFPPNADLFGAIVVSPTIMLSPQPNSHFCPFTPLPTTHHLDSQPPYI